MNATNKDQKPPTVGIDYLHQGRNIEIYNLKLEFMIRRQGGRKGKRVDGPLLFILTRKS